jgi:hypothetical protein
LQAVEDYRNVADPSVKKRKMLYVLLKVYWNKESNGGRIYYVRSD